MWSKKKKKKTLIYIISGILVIIGIGTVAYFFWPKNKSTENEESTNSNQRIQQLKTELNSLRSKLDNLSDTIQKTQLENKLSNLESQINNLSQPNNSPPTQSTLKKLEQEIKEIKKELEIKEEPEENSTCPYLDEVNLTTFDPKKMVISNEELTQWREVPHSYIVSLWGKGYHWYDILQLWEWKIPELEVPDLKTKKRAGVINELGVIPNPDRNNKNISEEEREKLDKHAGSVQNLVVIMRKIPGGGPLINIDKGQVAIPGYKKNVIHYTKKITNLFLEQEKINPADYQICVLDSLGAENFNQEDQVSFGKSIGKSIGSAVYLALLSAYHQQPISRTVAATGALSLSAKITKKGKVNQQEFTIQPGTNRPIRGLKWKTQAATGKGINRFVLSKYQTAPLLSYWDKGKKKWIQNEDDYQTVVPTETKTKIKEVHWAENIQELKGLILENKLS